MPMDKIMFSNYMNSPGFSSGSCLTADAVTKNGVCAQSGNPKDSYERQLSIHSPQK